MQQRDARGVLLSFGSAMEIAAAILALQGATAWAAGAHALSSGAIALALRERALDRTLVFTMALFIPVFGGLGMYAALELAPRFKAARDDEHRYTPIPGLQEAIGPRGRPRVPLDRLPAEARLASARRRNDPEAIAHLHSALDDPREDVRLVAHAVLESKSRAAHRRIRHSEERLEGGDDAQRGSQLQRVAAEYWELARLGLTRGECSTHLLDRARTAACAALEAGNDRAALHFLLARIELERGEGAGAETALKRAAALGVPPAIVDPYLAEAAFRERRFDDVKERLAQTPARADGAIERVRRFWS